MKNKEKIVRFTSEEIDKMPRQTDWQKFDSITDKELEETVKNDPDDLYLSDEELENGQWIENAGELHHKQHISMRVDADVLKFFKQQGKGYQSRMNRVLRAFMEAHLR